LHFIKTGIIDREYGKLFTKLYDFRQKGDYGDMYDYNEEIVLPLIDKVKDFLNEIKKQID